MDRQRQRGGIQRAKLKESFMKYGVNTTIVWALPQAKQRVSVYIYYYLPGAALNV